ncbi:MAG: SprB repeat-containing protein [Bacteroidales bacterium]|nr:SprB repeat-containing protein [Bacteroidales bacterium]
MKIKNWYLVSIMLLAMLAGCSKPDDDSLLLMENGDPIGVVALDAKDSFIGYYADVKGIADTCKSRTFPLTAGQNTIAGTVVVSNDADFLYVTFNTTGDWELDEVHLYLLESAPTGRLSPGQTPFKNDELADGTQTYTFAIPFDESLECGTTIWIQAHAATNGETAYGGTIVGSDQGSWYGSLSYAIECCEENECDLSASSVVTDVKCFGSATGMINVTVTGGTAPFTFIWSNGADTEDLANVPAGEYSVTIYDAAQCQFTLDEIMVLQPASGVSATKEVTHISSFGASDGAIDVTVSGGTAPYTYLWSTGATSQDLSNLGPGTYSVEITDANNCNTSLREILVEEPGEEKPMVAFARKTYASMVHCFLSDPMLIGYEFDQWGWTNGALTPDEEFISHYELFTNVDGCDPEGATKVGNMELHYFAGTATATITLVNGYTMKESRLFIGNDMLPKVGDDFTVDPANYPYVHSGLGAAAGDTFTVNGLSGNIYIIGYVVLNSEEDSIAK